MTTLAKADIELPWQVEVQQKAVPLLGCIICPRQGHHTIKKQVRTQETDSRPGSTNSSKFSKMLFLKSSIYKLVHQHMSRDRPAISPLGPQSVRTLRALNSRCAFSLSVTPHFRAMEIHRPNSSHSCHSRGRQVKEGLNLSPFLQMPSFIYGKYVSALSKQAPPGRPTTRHPVSKTICLISTLKLIRQDSWTRFKDQHGWLATTGMVHWARERNLSAQKAIQILYQTLQLLHPLSRVLVRPDPARRQLRIQPVPRRRQALLLRTPTRATNGPAASRRVGALRWYRR